MGSKKRRNDNSGPRVEATTSTRISACKKCGQVRFVDGVSGFCVRNWCVGKRMAELLVGPEDLSTEAEKIEAG